ncbi:MAG: GNAT family N-acetyltransferase, partial [Pirellulaceae bacterium]
RLLLRPFTQADAPVVQELLQCREIAAHTRSIEHPYPEGGAEKWISQHEEFWNEGKASVFAICEKPNIDVPVGAIGLELNSSDENAELGYWVGQPYWGRGFCTEAAEVVVRFGFDHFGLHKIHAHHMTRNPASGRVLKKIGMHLEGQLRGHIKKWGKFEDVAFYGLLASEAGG